MTQDPLDLTGAVVLVTGGCRGIGHGIAVRFLNAGARVVVCCRHAPDALPRATTSGSVARFIAGDVREDADVARIIDDLGTAEGRLDIVINNAGGSPPVETASSSPRFSAAVIALNLTGPLLVSQHANALMQTQDSGGSIINIASVSGMRASPGTAAYGAAKAGLLNLTQTLAVEWAPRVRVNAVSAGLIATESPSAHYGGTDEHAAMARTVPLGRFGTPDDVAGACLFLASPLAAYVSGANLVVHGGGERPLFLDAGAPPHG